MSNKFNPDWLRRFYIDGDGYAGIIETPDPDGTWIKATDHDRFIMEQAAEYQAEYQADIAELEAKLDTAHHCIDVLKSDLTAARRCGSCADAFKCHYHEDSSGLNWFDVKETCDKWRAI